MKNHKPQGPLFSRITNDFRGINDFFENKFEKVNLLYRASEHEFLVSKFHERCDGHRNTLTIILTEHGRVIGGFTPISWQSHG